MSLETEGSTGRLEGLRRVIDAWLGRGDARPAERWLDRELGEEDQPRRLSPEEGWEVLARLAAAARERGVEWPDEVEARVERLAKSGIPFLRPDGTVAPGPTGRAADVTETLRYWAKRLPDPGLEAAVRYVTGHPVRRKDAPYGTHLALGPRPAFALGGVRSGGDNLLAFDHRSDPAACRVEVLGRGRRWLGGRWAYGLTAEPTRLPRATAWGADGENEFAEWSFRVGAVRVVRTAILVGGLDLAILADEAQGADRRDVLDLDLPEGVSAAPISESRGLSLELRGGSARALPIGLPSLDYRTERGSFAVEGRVLRLTHAVAARRAWLPLLLSWDPRRNRRLATWRVLTVTEQSKVCSPGVAFAARVGWGHGQEGLVVYRSLAKPARRAFLGHLTTARMLVGRFTTEGEVVPLLSVD